MLRIITFSFLISGIFLSSYSQPISRSGNPASPEDKSLLRKFPCGGISIFDEHFDTRNIPATWMSIDVDDFAPHPNATQLTPNKGWQSVPDFKNPTGGNRILASPSWYEGNAGPSDDWLISPQIQNLPADICLSWYAYSQDRDFPESYEVRISTTTADLDSFLVLEPLVSIDQEGDEFTYRNLNLSIYEGEDIYLAFRQTSDDKFILALDDIRLAQVKNTDLAVLLIDPVNSPAGEDIFLSGALINQGLTEIDVDSGELQISYSINNTEAKSYAFPRSVTIAPNDTIQFVHDSIWAPSFDAVYWISVYFDAISNDGNPDNDTLARWQGVGTATAIAPQQRQLSLQASPNPMREELLIESAGEAPKGALRIRMMDMLGKAVLTEQRATTLPYRLAVTALPPGMYLLQVEDDAGRRYVQKVLKGE